MLVDVDDVDEDDDVDVVEHDELQPASSTIMMMTLTSDQRSLMRRLARADGYAIEKTP